MRRKFRVELAREIYNQIVTMGVVSPIVLNNACYLLGIQKSMNMKNQLLLYFMMKEKYDNYDKNIEPTELEMAQMSYVRKNIGKDLKNYIDTDLEGKIVVDPEKTFDKTQLLDVLFSAADTDVPQSHSEDDGRYWRMVGDRLEEVNASLDTINEMNEIEKELENSQLSDNHQSENSDNGDNQVVETNLKLVAKPKRKRTKKQ